MRQVVGERVWQQKVSEKILQFGNTSTRKPKLRKRRNALKSLTPIKLQSVEFKDFMHLHQLWTSYINKLVGTEWKNVQSILPSLVRADLHGCIVSLERSKIPSLVGMSGIILKETRAALEILTRENKLKGRVNCNL